MEKLASTPTGKLIVEATNSIASAMQVYPNDDKTKELLNKVIALRDKIVEVSFLNLPSFKLKEHSEKAVRYYKMLNHLVEAYRLSPDETLASHAENIHNLLSEHNSLSRQSFIEKTAAISMMVQDLGAEGARESVEAIPGMADVVAGLAATGEEMDAHYKSVLISRTSQKPEKTKGELKRELVRMINEELMVALSSAAFTDPDRFKAQLATIEEIIRHFNDAHNSGINRKDKVR